MFPDVHRDPGLFLTATELLEYYGLTSENIVQKALELLRVDWIEEV